jgi:hypothetical protein
LRRADWNRIYGRRGFVQHQCVFPLATAAGALGEMLDRIARRGDASFLTVLKKLGRRSHGVLSFPLEGFRRPSGSALCAAGSTRPAASALTSPNA